jgi:hypothetical protein
VGQRVEEEQGYWVALGAAHWCCRWRACWRNYMSSRRGENKDSDPSQPGDTVSSETSSRAQSCAATSTKEASYMFVICEATNTVNINIISLNTYASPGVIKSSHIIGYNWLKAPIPVRRHGWLVSRRWPEVCLDECTKRMHVVSVSVDFTAVRRSLFFGRLGLGCIMSGSLIPYGAISLYSRHACILR